MARHAIVDENGLVVSVVIWEGAAWLPPHNHYVVYSPIVNIGDSYDFENDTIIVADRTQRDEV